jgi:hypothetical protein
VDEGDRGPRPGAAQAALAETEAAQDAELGGRSAGSPPAVAGDAEARPTASVAAVCPFLRLDLGAALRPPLDRVDVDHRCLALERAVPLSDRQQALVCLTPSHADCPRYLRGTQVVPVTVELRRGVPRATLAAVAVLLISLGVTLMYTASHGGLAIPVGPSPAPSGAVVGSPPPASPTAAASSAPSTAPTPTGPSPTPSPAGSTPPASALPASPSPPPSLRPSATPGTSTPGSGATADRLALLRPCPDRADCYVYVVRAGDNLTSIGLYFGVPFDTILRLNPWIRDPANIHKGDQIVITTPTR